MIGVWRQRRPRSARQVRRSVTLPHEIAKQVEAISKQRRLSDNRVLVELIEQGIQAQRDKEKAFFELAHRFREGERSQRSGAIGRRVRAICLRRIMPKIASWSQMPAGIRQHLVQRMHDRSISLEDLNRLRVWIESRPEVAEGEWYKDFGSFKLCGQGQYPRTFLLPGQVATGERL